MFFLYLFAGGDLFDLNTLVSLFILWIVFPILIIGGAIYAVVDSKRPLKKKDDQDE